MVTIRQLEIFLAIVREKSIVAAAEKLYLSKPAMSMALTELEEKLDRKLFDRIKNRVILNDNGKQLFSLADELYQRSLEIGQLFQPFSRRQSSQNKQPIGKLRIGASNTTGNYLLPKILKQFRAETGHQGQEVLITNSKSICNKIAEYQLDIGLVEEKTPNIDLVYEHWRTDTMCIIAPFNFKNGIHNNNWILREEGSGSRTHFMQFILPVLKNWSLALELTTTESIINTVSAGIGLSYLSNLAIGAAVKTKQIKKLNFPNEKRLKRDLWIVSRSGRYRSTVVTEFLKYVK